MYFPLDHKSWDAHQWVPHRTVSWSILVHNRVTYLNKCHSVSIVSLLNRFLHHGALSSDLFEHSLHRPYFSTGSLLNVNDMTIKKLFILTHNSFVTPDQKMKFSKFTQLNLKISIRFFLLWILLALDWLLMILSPKKWKVFSLTVFYFNSSPTFLKTLCLFWKRMPALSQQALMFKFSFSVLPIAWSYMWVVQ